MTQNKFTVSNILKEKTTGHITKIYAQTVDRQPFDLLDVAMLVHYNAITIEGLKEELTQYEIAHDLTVDGPRIRLALRDDDAVTNFVDHIAPLYNDILQ